MAPQAPRWCRGHYCPFIGQFRYDDYCCGRCHLAHVARGPAGHGPSCSLKVLDAEMWASGVFHRRHNLRNTEEVQVLTPVGGSQGGEPVGESQGGESGESAAHKTSPPWNLTQEFIIGTINKGDGATELAADDGGAAGSAKGSAAGSAKGSAAGSAKGSAKGSAAGSAKGDQLEGEEEEEEEEETQLEGEEELVIEEALSADPPAKKGKQNDRIFCPSSKCGSSPS